MPAHRIARLIAVIAGIAGVVLCGLVPLLPVKQTTATIAWPQAPGSDGLISDITAPLVSGAPRALDASIPCRTVATLPRGRRSGVLHHPPAGIDASRNGLFVTANADVVVVAFRDTVAAVAPRPAVASGACSTLHVWANPGGVGADFVGIPGATGTLAAEKKPQVAGVFTDLKVARSAGPVGSRGRRYPVHHIADGTQARCDGAGRHLCDRLDRGVGGAGPPEPPRRRHSAGAPVTYSTRLATILARRACRRGSLDIGVIGILLLWHVIGAISSDDGYNLTIARVSGDAGYTANYFRFFGATEAPFDWYQSVLAHMAVDQHRQACGCGCPPPRRPSGPG